MDSALPQEAPLRLSAQRFPSGWPRRVLSAAVAMAALGPSPVLATDSGGSAPTAEGRVTPVEAIRAWLAPSAAATEAWSTATDATGKDAASRLGGPLLHAAAKRDDRLSAITTKPPDAPPEALDVPAGVAPSLRLAVAERLAADQRYDACLLWSEGVDAERIYSPALLHYLRAIAHHQLIDDEAARAELGRLDGVLDASPASGAESPLGVARQWVVDRLREGLAAEAGPLESVVRRMRDSERRLAHSDAGDRAQQQQQTILDELDKLIDKLEEQRKQQQQQQQAAGGSGRGAEPGRPAEESRPGELKGPGEVDRKRLVAGDPWGALPPAERERLTQAITRDFPPHYRTLVEDYFRTLAAEADRADATPPPAQR